MSTLSPVLSLLAALVGILQVVIIIRILISYFPQISPFNPGVKLLRSIADPMLAPFRRVLPIMAGIDFTPLLVLLVLHEVEVVLDTLANSAGFTITHVVADLVFQLISDIILFFCIVLIIRVLVQLLQADPFHPLVLVIRQITNPLMLPFRGITRNPDVAPIIALSAYLLLYIVVTFFLEPVVNGL